MARHGRATGRKRVWKYEVRVSAELQSIEMRFQNPAQTDLFRPSLESAVEQLEHLILPLGKSRPYMVSDGFLEGGEVRHMHMGIDDGGKVVLFVTTMRPNETVRIISYRRASDEEKVNFYEHTGYLEKQG